MEIQNPVVVTLSVVGSNYQPLAQIPGASKKRLEAVFDVFEGLSCGVIRIYVMRDTGLYWNLGTHVGVVLIDRNPLAFHVVEKYSSQFHYSNI